MKESFRIRHKILEILFKAAEKENNPQIPTIRVSDTEIAMATKLPLEKITRYHELLHEEDEVQCEYCEVPKTHRMLITSKGRQSYIDEKYLKEGRKQFWDTIYDPLKIILPIVSLGLSIFVLYQNSNSNTKIDALEKQTKDFNTKIDSLGLNAGQMKSSLESELKNHSFRMDSMSRSLHKPDSSITPKRVNSSAK